MTGLAVETDRILEVACLITDENLNIVSDEFHQVLHQSDIDLARMDAWCQEHHTKVLCIYVEKLLWSYRFIIDVYINFFPVWSCRGFKKKQRR